MAEPDAAPPAALAADLQQQLDSARAESARQQLEAEQTLHDLTAKLSTAEQAVQATQQSLIAVQGQLEQEREKRVEAERMAVQVEEGRKGDSAKDDDYRKKLEQADKEKRDLLEALEREQRERASVEGVCSLGYRPT